MDFGLSEEQRALQDAAEKIAVSLAKVPAPEDAYPFEYLQMLARYDLTGIDLPESDGGQGQRLVDAILVLEAATKVSPRVGDAVQATNFGPIRQIAALGSPEIRQRFLPPLLRGEALASVAISEPEAGSAVSEMRTSARVEGEDVIIDGSKVFNSNGPFVTHFVVWARFSEGARGIGAIVVPGDAPGFSRGKPEHYLSGELHCALYFDGCRVPAANILAEEGGLHRLMPIFNIERLGNAARSLACGWAALDLAIEHLAQRRVGGRPLAEYQGLRWKVAEARTNLEAARLLLYRAATEMRDGMPEATLSAMAKYACNKAGYEAANEAAQLFGGYGMSTEYPLAYLLARTRAWMIAGGSLEVMRNRIADGLLGRAGGRSR
jgi:alkylation response protein AidB-like acyl-CoA dehydrogenase